MSYEEVVAMVTEMGLPHAYDHFAEGESPNPPFLIFLYPGSDNFAADGKVYFAINRLNLELYTDKKDLELEARVESVLSEHELFFNKTEVWIASEHLYEVLYELEV